MKRIVLKEERLRSIVKETINRILNEGFEDDFNSTRDNFHKSRPGGMFGFEMKNAEDEWEYGDIQYDPKSQQMSCMGVSIDVDPSMTVDAHLEALYEKLVENGYHDD